MAVNHTAVTPPTFDMLTAFTNPNGTRLRQWPIKSHDATHRHPQIGLDWVVIHQGWVLRDRGSPASGAECHSANTHFAELQQGRDGDGRVAGPKPPADPPSLWRYAEVAGEGRQP